jgi:PAS domain S-box-containing protein
MQRETDFRALVDAIGDGVIVCDAQGAITHWNPAAERIFGFTRDDAMGQSLDIIIPERQRQRHWDGYHKTISTGVTKYGHDLLKVPALHKDGRQISIAFTVAMLYDAAGAVTDMVSIVRDETARFTEERALRKRLTELEMQGRTPASAPPG